MGNSFAHAVSERHGQEKPLGPGPAHPTSLDEWQIPAKYQERRIIVDDKQRHRRLRLLTKQLNKERKKQAQKIDILCNDLIGAQRNFIKRLNTISFIANFCESIIGATDLNNLLYTAAGIIQAENNDAHVTFFLKEGGDPSAVSSGPNRFGLHVFESSRPIAVEKQHLEACFTHELMDGICRSNKVCTLDDMFALGLQANLTGLNNISAVTIPLGLPGSSLGFMLLYHSLENKLNADAVERISAITGGLSRAIASCQEDQESKCKVQNDT
jgi:hypothetical protein